MAFGKQVATSAQKIQDHLASRQLDEHGQPRANEQEDAGPAAIVPPVAASPSATSTRPGAFGRPSPQPAVETPSVSAPAPSASHRPRPMETVTPPPVAAAPAVSSRPTASDHRPSTPPPREVVQAPSQATAPAVSDLFSGYRQVMELSRRADGLPLRVERLIDEIADFHGHPRDRTENAKKLALEDVKGWEKKLFDHYQKVVRPARQQTAQTLQEARQKHPGKGVFVMVSKGQSTIQTIDPSKPDQQNMGILNGATVERVASSRTPFRSPREVFGRQETLVTLENADDAFGEVDANPTPGKPPKP